MLLASATAHAQCTKDTDCKGDRVCEAGKCAAPLPPAPPPPPGNAATPSDAASPPVATPAPEVDPPAPAMAAPAVVPPALAAEPSAPIMAPPAATAPVRDEPEVERRSRGAMIAGIVMASVGPIALLGALAAKSSQESCDDELENDYPDHRLPTSERYRAERCDSYTTPLYVLGIGGAILTVGSVPLIIYGAKTTPKKPQASVNVTPWATREAGGLKLRLSL